MRLANERHTRSNDSDYSTSTTTMQGQVAKIVIVMEYLAARLGDLTLYFGLITRNNYHNITLGKKRHHHSKPTDQKYSTFSQWGFWHLDLDSYKSCRVAGDQKK